ncbi:MAG: hypothetical protein R3175_06795 [Marinobacter sp.]|uniref:hypothetical protein n=1 Tax=Marinobacter sp. TaxID=50741 RepID=UPI00299EF06B|nr:hypothetical protein [Marinobacter sp.]MDX1755748.1 hypothetical protein [Marinobacter sp.]
MLISAEMAYTHARNPLVFREKDDVSERSIVDSPASSISPRYRDGMGGVNLEQVKRDHRRARQEVVRAMLQRLGNLWHRR